MFFWESIEEYYDYHNDWHTTLNYPTVDRIIPEGGFVVMSHGLLTMALAHETPEVATLMEKYQTLKENHNDCLDNADEISADEPNADEPRVNDHVRGGKNYCCLCHCEQNMKSVLDDIFNDH